jgi:TorA maturation chaperone TorD
MTTTQSELLELMWNRARLYSFFSRMFSREVDLELLSALKKKCHSVPEDEEGSTPGLRELRRFFQRAALSNRILEELAADFAGLFLGISRSPVYPCESVYRSSNGLVMGESRFQVMQYLESEGLEKRKQYGEPEDHISILFDFMTWLCRRLSEELTRRDTKSAMRTLSIQNEFFHTHILSWVGEFLNAVIEWPAHHEFYSAIGHMAHQFLLGEETIFPQLRAALDEHAGQR